MYYASTTVYVVDCTNRDSSPHDWYTLTLHTYIQSWKFAYLFSSSEEKIKFTCQKVRCVSSNNNREEQKKFHFQQQQHIGLLIMLVEFQLLISAFLSLYDICYWTKWYFISLYQNMKRVQSYKNGVGVFWKLCHSPISLLWLELAYKL